MNTTTAIQIVTQAIHDLGFEVSTITADNEISDMILVSGQLADDSVFDGVVCSDGIFEIETATRYVDNKGNGVIERDPAFEQYLEVLFDQEREEAREAL